MDQNQNGEQVAMQQAPTSIGQVNPGVQYGFLHLTATVPDGANIPSWHGVWMYDHASQQAHTSVVVLNVILAIAFAMVKWVKYGGINVAADPRQAFVDGLNAGYNEAVESLPAEMQEERTKLLGARSALEAQFGRVQRVMDLHKIAASLSHQLKNFEAGAEADIGSIVANLRNIGTSFEDRIRTALSEYDKLQAERNENPAAVDPADGGIAKQLE